MTQISIIICTYNGCARLAPTLGHIAALYIPEASSAELIIVDNKSNDGTSGWCEEWLSSHAFPFAWKVVNEPLAGLSYARKRGIAEAKGEILLFCDDDNHLQADYVQVALPLFHAHPNWAVLGGYGEPVFEETPPAWFERFHYSYAVGPQAKSSGTMPLGSELYGAACFFRAAAIKKLFTSGFSSALSDRKGQALSSGGDVELCYALQLQGWKLGYEDCLRFKHFMPAARLSEAYYLKLKAAIASQAGLMHAYHYLLFEEHPTKTGFLSSYAKAKSRTNWRYFRSRIIHSLRLSKGSLLEKKVAKAVLHGKLKSFINSQEDALLLFHKLLLIRQK